MARMTIRDIARLAGVSVTTVSRALNNAPEINSQTRERVLQVCREQGYRSNLLARSLVSSRTRVLGVILPELSGPFHASIVLHLERYAQEQDYQIMLCCGRVGAAKPPALFDFLVSHRWDGILLVSGQQRRARSAAAPRTGDALRAAGDVVPDRYAPADQRCQHRQLCRRRHGGRDTSPGWGTGGCCIWAPGGTASPMCSGTRAFSPSPGSGAWRWRPSSTPAPSPPPPTATGWPGRCSPPLPADGGLRSL